MRTFLVSREIRAKKIFPDFIGFAGEVRENLAAMLVVIVGIWKSSTEI